MFYNTNIKITCLLYIIIFVNDKCAIEDRFIVTDGINAFLGLKTL